MSTLIPSFPCGSCDDGAITETATSGVWACDSCNWVSNPEPGPLERLMIYDAD